jgi:hypothetical protein
VSGPDLEKHRKGWKQPTFLVTSTEKQTGGLGQEEDTGAEDDAEKELETDGHTPRDGGLDGVESGVEDVGEEDTG